jgi:oligopeptide transport system substrate-binding protein
VTGPRLSTRYLGFNVRRPPFDDTRVRRAFVLALDRRRLPEVGTEGGLGPATGGFVPPGMPGHSAGIGLPYDPEGARGALAEAGYPEGRGFPPVEAVANNRMLHWLGGDLERQWGQILGVEIAWEPLEWTAYLEKLYGEGPADIFVLGWGADYPDPDNFLRVSSFRPLTGWQNAHYDRLVEKARRVMDQAERMRLYREADTILMEEAPVIPLAYDRMQLLVQPWVRTVPTTPIGADAWKDVVIERH